MKAFIYLCLAHFILYWLTSFLFFLFDMVAYCCYCTHLKYDTVTFKRYLKYCRAGIVNVLRNQFITMLLGALYADKLLINSSSVFNTMNFVFYILINDVYFFCAHKLLHCNRFIYTVLHKHHHREHFTSACCALDSSIIEHLFVNVASVVVGPVLIGGSNFTICAWILVATVNSCIAHSGFKYISKTHNLHHNNPKYNFGTGLMLMDSLFDTKYNDHKYSF